MDPNSKYSLPGGSRAGFLAGLWHGLICPVTFIVSLFNPKVRIYEQNNNGGWYDFGFVVGVSGSFWWWRSSGNEQHLMSVAGTVILVGCPRLDAILVNRGEARVV